MIRDLKEKEYPELLREIPDRPKRLRLWGELPHPDHRLLAVVGSRKFSSYGAEMCRSIIMGLSNSPVVIVSGLALGIDSIAHRSAIEAGIQTIAIPGSGLDPKVLHPHSHLRLAEEIVEAGGGLISEMDDTEPAGVWSFPRRNRIMAGMCHATLVIEAGVKSGTLITSRLATEYNRDVGAIPGPANSPTSDGPHMLIRLGAALIRDHHDALELLGLDPSRTSELFNVDDLSDQETAILKHLEVPLGRDELIKLSKLDTSLATATLSLMEIKGLISEELGLVRKTF
jgi:DNA processing protein